MFFSAFLCEFFVFLCGMIITQSSAEKLKVAQSYFFISSGSFSFSHLNRFKIIT